MIDLQKFGLKELTGDKLCLLKRVGKSGQYICGWLSKLLINQADPLRGCVRIRNLTIV
jgi:hypothetical protein